VAPRPDQDRLVLPTVGCAGTVLFDGHTIALWWGEGETTDVLATRGGRVLAWPDVESCVHDARERGWPGADDEPDDEDPWTLDLEPAQAWLRGARHTLDPVAALNLWNLQWDVVASLTGSYPVLGRLQGRCHDKLTVANVPYLAGLDDYAPRWTPAELRVLRRTLAGAVHDLRTAFRDRVVR